MKTVNVKPANITKNWLVVDAEGKVLGRLASEVAYFLRGKHKPTFTPHLDGGDFVVIVNAEKVKLTGNKYEDKMYYHHTGYIGGIKGQSAREILEKKPENLLRTAVKGMLPKNKLGRKMFKNLKVYSGSEHPHSAQKPVALGARLNNQSQNSGAN